MSATKLDKSMQYTIVRKNDAPSGDYNLWVFKAMQGERVIRHGAATTQAEATAKAKGLLEDEPVKIVFSGMDEEW